MLQHFIFERGRGAFKEFLEVVLFFQVLRSIMNTIEFLSESCWVLLKSMYLHCNAGIQSAESHAFNTIERF